MSGGAHTQEAQPPVHWEEKYIERLSRDMEGIRGMESRINSKIDNLQTDLQGRIDANNKQTQNLVLAMIIGIGAMTIAIAIAMR